MKHNALWIIFFVFIVGCSGGNWKHTFTGESGHWQAVMEIERAQPREKFSQHEPQNVYTFKLAKRFDEEVTKLFYEAHVPNGRRAGNLDPIKLRKLNQQELLTLARDYPNDNNIDQNTSTEILENYFSSLRIMIKWEDKNGEHAEEIYLKL